MARPGKKCKWPVLSSRLLATILPDEYIFPKGQGHCGPHSRWVVPQSWATRWHGMGLANIIFLSPDPRSMKFYNHPVLL